MVVKVQTLYSQILTQRKTGKSGNILHSIGQASTMVLLVEVMILIHLHSSRRLTLNNQGGYKSNNQVNCFSVLQTMLSELITLDKYSIELNLDQTNYIYWLKCCLCLDYEEV